MIRVLLLMYGSGCDSYVFAGASTDAAGRSDANETFFGTEVRDPYRWLEDVKSPEVATWMKSQSDYTMSLLARIPGRQAMFERIVKYEEAIPARVVQVARETGDRWFFERRGANENQFKLLSRQGCAARTACWLIPRRLKSAPASRTRSITTVLRLVARWWPMAFRRRDRKPRCCTC